MAVANPVVNSRVAELFRAQEKIKQALLNELLIAVKAGNMANIIEILKDHPEFSKYRFRGIGAQIIHFAIDEDKFAVVKFLIENKYADVNDADNENANTIYYAAGYGLLHIVQYLEKIPHANITARDKNGYNPLAMAAAHGRLAMVEYFLKNTFSKHSDLDDFYAAVMGALNYNTNYKYASKDFKDAGSAILKLLLNHQGVLEHTIRRAIKDKHLENGYVQVIKYLDQENLLAQVFTKGDNALSIAIESGSLETVKYLCQNNIIFPGLDAAKIAFLAYRYLNLEIIECVLNYLNDKKYPNLEHILSHVITSLLEDQQFNDNNTSNKILNIVLIFLKYGVGIDKVTLDLVSNKIHSVYNNSSNKTPMLLKIKHLLEAAQNLLLLADISETSEEQSANFELSTLSEGDVKLLGDALNARTQIGGDTALHLAMKRNNFNLVFLLVQHGASLELLNKECITPENLANSGSSPAKSHIRAFINIEARLRNAIKLESEYNVLIYERLKLTSSKIDPKSMGLESKQTDEKNQIEAITVKIKTLKEANKENGDALIKLCNKFKTEHDIKYGKDNNNEMDSSEKENKIEKDNKAAKDDKLQNDKKAEKEIKVDKDKKTEKEIKAEKDNKTEKEIKAKNDRKAESDKKTTMDVQEYIFAKLGAVLANTHSPIYNPVEAYHFLSLVTNSNIDRFKQANETMFYLFMGNQVTVEIVDLKGKYKIVAGKGPACLQTNNSESSEGISIEQSKEKTSESSKEITKESSKEKTIERSNERSEEQCLHSKLMLQHYLESGAEDPNTLSNLEAEYAFGPENSMLGIPGITGNNAASQLVLLELIQLKESFTDLRGIARDSGHKPAFLLSHASQNIDKTSQSSNGISKTQGSNFKP